MHTKTLISILAAALIVVLMPACEKNNADTAQPAIDLISPDEGDTLYLGSGIHFEAEFSDDTELKSYKIDIHDNFDGHSHKALTEDSTPWHYQESWTFEPGTKNSHMHHHDIVIPEEIDGLPVAEGAYHFIIYCTDAAGNEAWQATPIHVLSPATR